MTLTELIEKCYKLNPNKHIHNGDVFYINCYGYGSIRRKDNKYYVSTGILESFRYHDISTLNFNQLDCLHLVLEKILITFEEIINNK